MLLGRLIIDKRIAPPAAPVPSSISSGATAGFLLIWSLHPMMWLARPSFARRAGFLSPSVPGSRGGDA